jgi:ketosteroid isomerase-like protein
MLRIATPHHGGDAVVEQPLALPEPGRWIGRETMRQHFGRRTALPFTLAVRDLVVHRTDDPEVVVAEYDYLVTVTATGKRSTLANVVVLRVRDGLIQHSRDYHDHARLAALLTD